MVIKFFIICLCIIIVCMANYEEQNSEIDDKKDRFLMITFAKDKYRISTNSKMVYIPIEAYSDKQWVEPPCNN